MKLKYVWSQIKGKNEVFEIKKRYLTKIISFICFNLTSRTKSNKIKFLWD